MTWKDDTVEEINQFEYMSILNYGIGKVSTIAKVEQKRPNKLYFLFIIYHIHQYYYYYYHCFAHIAFFAKMENI